MNTNTNNNLNKSQESENNLNKENNDNMSLGVTIPSKKNGGLVENNETEEDIVRGFGPSGMNSMINDENTSNFNHSNINNNSGMSAINIMNNKNTFGKKKGIVNTNKEIQQIKEAEEKEEEENYAYDFTLDNKTLKKL